MADWENKNAGIGGVGETNATPEKGVRAGCYERKDRQFFEER
jgi:hypothetical protein